MFSILRTGTRRTSCALTSSCKVIVIESRQFSTPAERTEAYKNRDRLPKPPRLPPRDDGRVRHNKIKGERSPFTTPMNIHGALDTVKANSWVRFDEGIDIAVQLNLDPRKANQNVKGVAKLPAGSGKKVRVAVLAQGEDANNALNAGADIVGAEDLVQKISSGELNFDVLIATPEMMGQLGKLGRILGPRGLMPNPKLGTVTKEVSRAVKDSKGGKVSFRVDKKGIMHAGIGRVSFTHEQLIDNVRSLMVGILDVKPEGLKGAYFQRVFLNSSQGPGIPVELATVDPSNVKFMLTPEQLVQ